MNKPRSNRTIIKGTAIILCFIFPGVGQIYLGNYKKGFLFYILALTMIIFPLMWLISLIDILFDKKSLDRNIENPFSNRTKVIVVSLLVAPFILLFLAFEGYFLLNEHVLAEGRTIKEMTRIEESIIDYELNYGRYPDSLDELISVRPIRKGWMKDYWNREYFYSSNDSEFVLISSGKDRKLYTDDDIKRGVNISN